MGYNRETILTCSNPDMIGVGSRFNKKWKNAVKRISQGESEYYFRNETLHDDVIDLTKENQDLVFSGLTWDCEDYDHERDYAFIISNGKMDVTDATPHYFFSYPEIENEEYFGLLHKFIKLLREYYRRLDLLVETEDSFEFDILTTGSKDKDGFNTSFTIKWSDDKHIFTATRENERFIKITYEEFNLVNYTKS
jgi:hypothetical protein